MSPLLFSLYTNSCTSNSPSVKLLKFADDTTVIGLIRDKDETSYRDEVEHLVQWCTVNNLTLNISKTKELIVDFRKSAGQHTPICINGQVVEWVDSFRFLGTTIHQSLSWNLNTSLIISKAQQRLYFLRQLRKFGVSQAGMIHFYSATIESVLTFSILVWYGSSTSQEKQHLERVVRRASKIIGRSLPTLASLYNTRLARKAKNITSDPTHPAHHLFTLLPSGKRYRSIPSKTTRSRDSTYPQAIRHLNTH